MATDSLVDIGAWMKRTAAGRYARATVPSAQLPVSEAAPGNPAYTGGRWITYTVMWTQAAFDELGTVPILTSYQVLMDYEALGYLAIAQGPPEGTPAYFQCPLLPVK